jgi:flavin reductase (DIM6/NTAB) family NADH-FMN oxidoreductase RutF
VLDEAPAWFSGVVQERSQMGDHTAFLIEVDTADVRRQPERLLRLTDVDDFDPGHEA